jgi:hypothetical protein
VTVYIAIGASRSRAKFVTADIGLYGLATNEVRLIAHVGLPQLLDEGFNLRREVQQEVKDGPAVDGALLERPHVEARDDARLLLAPFRAVHRSAFSLAWTLTISPEARAKS